MTVGKKIKVIDRLRLGFAVSMAKSVTFLVRSLRLGAASVLPGSIARRIEPRILELLSQQVKNGVILIAGTNGKTTTALLLCTILERNGFCVAHNSTGANLENGLATALIDNASLLGNLNVDYAILEVDENIVPKVLKPLQPRIILCLNLFRDQLDRYGEVDSISKRWTQVIATLPTTTVVIPNADDPTLSYLGQQLPQKVLFFGLNEPENYLEAIPHAVDSIYCPRCGHALDYQGVYLSHLGDFTCPSCGFTKSKPALLSQEWPQILVGLYNKYNTLAAATAAQALGVDEVNIRDGINNFQAAFGRAEDLVIDGKRVRILLSKNPVGTNETIRVVTQSTDKTTLLVLNDRTPDGTDVSWIWDVDTEKLVARGGTLIVSGDRVYDMALRLRYSQESLDSDINLIVEPNLQQAIATALEHTPANETLHILPTYSAMLEVREVLTGRKIL
ncbi:MAG: Mur ligase family protein [Nostocales cyanobacterium LacPavin_0920_SED1_MAG_38_18]|jgi:UDP-N-acetylmuramyl tripeptide synthase|uniref:Lipid II isoglutaminyl synthase (glutamine-hydrolyzing) subunit MurT n=1 Tax=Aphanizomenon flos-aquae FACHB-1040 TaxID=2692887 RepID=A0ABR8C137_APHFL|nr:MULTISPECIES: Mur ligase family protein [Aphanizomenonaceae]MBD2280757.1 Mur ligase family protein [Aphanizomenon flos-aquae FACHB-1040]MBE9256776.1 Mur ligase family protein [Dolichospermum sp. LEGE 00246]MCX5982792.1 Mur ligase family protein [Nostocales cyanobacterium LacPavin_0920_SED1_MAG_38_18]